MTIFEVKIASKDNTKITIQNKLFFNSQEAEMELLNIFRKIMKEEKETELERCIWEPRYFQVYTIEREIFGTIINHVIAEDKKISEFDFVNLKTEGAMKEWTIY